LILFIAAVFAAGSMFFVPPNIHYVDYLDFAVLGILFSLMVVVEGFKRLGLFDFLSQALLGKTNSVRLLSVLLIGCVFICSGFITNDVALLAFVPMTIGIFALTGQKKLIFIIVLETLSANLGSMLTPVGNPQNLYIYSFYNLNILQFFKYVLPIGGVSLIILTALTLAAKNGSVKIALEKRITLRFVIKPLIFYAALFAL